MSQRGSGFHHGQTHSQMSKRLFHFLRRLMSSKMEKGMVLVETTNAIIPVNRVFRNTYEFHLSLVGVSRVSEPVNEEKKSLKNAVVCDYKRAIRGMSVPWVGLSDQISCRPNAIFCFADNCMNL